MRLRVQTLLAAALVLAVLLTGCGRAANGNKSYAYTTAEDAYAPGASNESVTESAATRQVIITAGYSVEVKDFSAAAEALEKLTAQHSGYTEQAELSDPESAAGSGRYSLRIPAEQLDAFAEGLKAVGRIRSGSKSEEDVTEQYQDIQAQINARTTQRDRLLELVEKAETLEDLLKLEEQLTQVQTELDSLIGRQKLYDNQVRYATVSVRLYAADRLAGGDSYGSELKTAFFDAFNTAFSVVKFLGVALVWLLPVLLVAAVVLAIVLPITRRRRRLRREGRSGYQSPAPPPKQL